MAEQDFQTLVLAELDAVYRLAYHLTSGSEAADDLVQETYLRAFKSASSFRANEHGVRPWLFKILHNALNTRHTQAQRQRSLVEHLQDEPAAAAERAEDLAPLPAELAGLDWDRVDERLKAAIHDLSLPHRTTFLLCAAERLTYRQIADVTGVPIGTVMSRLYRARSLLAARLAGLAAERGFRVPDDGDRQGEEGAD